MPVSHTDREGVAQYNWLPSTNLFRSAPFYIVYIIYLCYNTNNLDEEVNCKEPSPSISVPCLISYHLNAVKP